MRSAQLAGGARTLIRDNATTSLQNARLILLAVHVHMSKALGSVSGIFGYFRQITGSAEISFGRLSDNRPDPKRAPVCNSGGWYIHIYRNSEL